MSRVDPTGAPLPDPASGSLVVPPPGGPGSGAGAPSAVRHDGAVYLAYRVRRVEGCAVVVARSSDGVAFEVLAVVDSERLGVETLGRPALVVTPPGRWRLHVSGAASGSEHVELLETDSPESFPTAPSRTVLPGVADPVVQSHGGIWHLWAAVRRLGDPARTTTGHATSPDGVTWTRQGTALAPRPGGGDSRGVRISAVVDLGDRLVATYDGRGADGAEGTGVAVTAGGFGRFRAVDGGPAVLGVRHLEVLPLPGGDYRLYYEATRPDGAHELRTELVPMR